MVILPSANIKKICTFAAENKKSATMNELRTLAILDDQPLILAALKNDLSSFYDIRIVTPSVSEFLLQIENERPDLVLLDILLGSQSGVEVAQIVKKKYPNVKILMLSIDIRRETFCKLLDIGVDGFVSKKAPTTEVVHAVDVVIRGEKYYGKDVSRLIREIQISMASGNEPSFTRLEIDILYACCEGKNSAQIGQMLKMSPRTVEAHKNTLFVKLGVSSTTELIVKAIRQGIITI